VWRLGRINVPWGGSRPNANQGTAYNSKGDVIRGQKFNRGKKRHKESQKKASSKSIPGRGKYKGGKVLQKPQWEWEGPIRKKGQNVRSRSARKNVEVMPSKRKQV